MRPPEEAAAVDFVFKYGSGLDRHGSPRLGEKNCRMDTDEVGVRERISVSATGVGRVIAPLCLTLPKSFRRPPRMRSSLEAIQRLSERAQDRFQKRRPRRRAVCGLTDDFYKYPACFSPIFGRVAIETFTKPGSSYLTPMSAGGRRLSKLARLGAKVLALISARWRIRCSCEIDHTVRDGTRNTRSVGCAATTRCRHSRQIDTAQPFCQAWIL